MENFQKKTRETDKKGKSGKFTKWTESAEALEALALPDFDIPKTGRVAGIDFGTVRIGIAVCDPERIIASPLENYSRRNLKLDAQFFKQLATEERVALWVVGLPLYPSGDESEKSIQAREFGKWLWETTRIPVVFFDERYSSKFADELMGAGALTQKQRKSRRDKLAAYVVLSAWLESDRKKLKAPVNSALDDDS